MKYAVLYKSENGNTQQIAEEIFESIAADDKEIYDLGETDEMPQADVYFIGFGVHNGDCGLAVLNCLEQISGGCFALFATCGLLPSESYKASLEEHLEVWMPDDSEYLGMLLCQGRVRKDRRAEMVKRLPADVTANPEALEKILDFADEHPNARDFQQAGYFARTVQEKADITGDFSEVRVKC